MRKHREQESIGDMDNIGDMGDYEVQSINVKWPKLGMEKYDA